MITLFSMGGKFLAANEPIRKVERKRFEKILSSQHEVEIEPNLNKLARANFEGSPKNILFFGVLGFKRFRRSTLYFADRLIGRFCEFGLAATSLNRSSSSPFP